MQKLYLTLAVIGFSIPLAALPATFEHGNLLLMANAKETISLAFANYVAAAFTADLLWVFVVFCAWVVVESPKANVKHPWVFIVLAFLFGVSGPLPLFLYHRERARVAVSVIHRKV